MSHGFPCPQSQLREKLPLPPHSHTPTREQGQETGEQGQVRVGWRGLWVIPLRLETRPSFGREQIADVWLLMSLLQRQLCASPHVCTMAQRLFLLRGTQTRQPLQGPMGTLLV